MKLGFVNKISPLVGYIALLVTAVSSIIVRAIQLLYAIDYRTGFYNPHFSVSLLKIIMIVMIPVSILLILVGKRENLSEKMVEQKSILVTITFVATGLMMMIQGIFKIAVSVIAVTVEDVTTPSEVSDYLIIFLLFLSGLALIVAAKNNHKGMKNSLLFAIPTIYFCVQLMITFMAHTTIANISENLLEVLLLCAIVVFFCSFGKIIIGISGKFSEVFLTISACATVVLGAVVLLPQYIVMIYDAISGTEYSYYLNPSQHIDYIGAFVLAIIVMWFYVAKSKTNSTLAEQDAAVIDEVSEGISK